MPSVYKIFTPPQVGDSTSLSLTPKVLLAQRLVLLLLLPQPELLIHRNIPPKV